MKIYEERGCPRSKRSNVDGLVCFSHGKRRLGDTGRNVGVVKIEIKARF